MLHGVSVDIDEGEFVVLGKPSGCVKSTSLRMVWSRSESSCCMRLDTYSTGPSLGQYGALQMIRCPMSDCYSSMQIDAPCQTVRQACGLPLPGRLSKNDAM